MLLIEHQRQPGVVGPGSCPDCAHAADLSDPRQRLQRREQAVRRALGWSLHAHHYALHVWSWGIGIPR